jgi:hypothetical protein
MVTTAEENLQKARENLWAAEEAAIEAKTILEEHKFSLMLSGKLDGKNAEIRQAQSNDMLVAELEMLETDEKKERRARYEYDRASIDLDTAKTLLRIAELK